MTIYIHHLTLINIVCSECFLFFAHHGNFTLCCILNLTCPLRQPNKTTLVGSTGGLLAKDINTHTHSHSSSCRNTSSTLPCQGQPFRITLKARGGWEFHPPGKTHSGTKFAGAYYIKPSIYIWIANNCKNKSLPLKIWMWQPLKIRTLAGWNLNIQKC